MIAWIDLETTGLDPQMCSILEAALIVTDDKLHEVARYESGAIRPSGSKFEPGAMKMHGKSGLWRDVFNSDTYYFEVDQEMTAILSQFKPEDGKGFILGGASVHFDRSFLEVWMPETCALLHYRNYDVTTLKYFWSQVTGKLEDSERPHRAMQDIEDTLTMARRYVAMAKVWRKAFLAQ